MSPPAATRLATTHSRTRHAVVDRFIFPERSPCIQTVEQSSDTDLCRITNLTTTHAGSQRPPSDCPPTGAAGDPSMSDDTILVVEDDPTVTHLYNQFLEPEYTVVTTTTAAEAIDVLNGEQAPEGEELPDSIDAVLLDRRLPDEPGETVLDVIEEQDLDCRVAMVTGVEPDFDIIDMGFDLYILKPVTRDELTEAVETLFTRSEYGGLLQEAASLASKRALLEANKADDELDASDEYHDLLDRMEDLDDELLDLADTLSADDYRVMFRDIGSQ